MNFDHSDKTKELMARVEKFMDENVYPNESVYEEQMQAFGENRWQIPQILEDLKEKAKAEGLWNFFLPGYEGEFGTGLSNFEYSHLAEKMGAVGMHPKYLIALLPIQATWKFWKDMEPKNNKKNGSNLCLQVR